MATNSPFSLRIVHTTDKVVQLRRLFAGIIDIALVTRLQLWIDGIPNRQQAILQWHHYIKLAGDISGRLACLKCRNTLMLRYQG